MADDNERSYDWGSRRYAAQKGQPFVVEEVVVVVVVVVNEAKRSQMLKGWTEKDW